MWVHLASHKRNLCPWFLFIFKIVSGTHQILEEYQEWYILVLSCCKPLGFDKQKAIVLLFWVSRVGAGKMT